MELYEALTNGRNGHGASSNGRNGQNGHGSSNGQNGQNGHGSANDVHAHALNGAFCAHVNGVSRAAENGHADERSVASTRAVVLAGGRGARLAPYTSVLPKPLMPIGERAILEVVVEQLESHGITDITFCVGYLSHLIRTVFDNRSNGHVKIDYVHEEEALGTAGPLRLVDGLDDTFLVMNGDVLTTIDYADLVRHHRESGNALTIATRERPIKIDYGVLYVEDRAAPSRIVRFVEKPEVQSTVSMGIYVFEPRIVEYVPRGRQFDFPQLVEALLRNGEPVGAYPFDGVWFDIGREDDYARAVQEWENGGLNGANGNGHGNGNGHANGNGHVNGNGHANGVPGARAGNDHR